MIEFEKYQGTGNDFIITQNQSLITNPEQVRKICDRHFGIGADGVLIVGDSEVADIRMTYLNSDGSPAPMCGNGLRCFVRYVMNRRLLEKPQFLVETLAGIIPVIYDEKIKGIKIFLEKPDTFLDYPDVSKTLTTGLNTEITINDQKLIIHIMFIGTLHAVFYLDDNPEIDIKEYGPLISKHSLFPKQINVNFVEVVDYYTQRVTTYERGSGWTLSCGTGACASAVVSYRLKKTSYFVKTIVPGGELTVYARDTVVLIGPAVKIASGYYHNGN